MRHRIIEAQHAERRGHGWNTLRLVPPGPARSIDDRHVAKVLRLIAGVNAAQGRSPPRTDFNAELLGLALEPDARASLGPTLQRLVAAGLMVCRGENEYSLTEAGVRSMQRARRDLRSV